MKIRNEEVSIKLDEFAKNLETIKTMQYSDEILVEFIKNHDLSAAIRDVNDRHFILDCLKEKQEEQAEQQITDEKMIEKIDKLTAPKIEEEVFELIFKVRGTKTKLKELKEFLEKGGYDYE